MTPAAEDVISRVKSKFSDAFTAESTRFGDAVVVVTPAKWPSVAKWLATDAGFVLLSDLCAVDWFDRDPRFDIVYNLTNITEPSRLTVKLPVAMGDPPKAPSVTSVWPTANFHEREVFDMFGIVFDGHPNLERILMPEEWEGHPLRKDYAIGKVPIEFKRMQGGV